MADIRLTDAARFGGGGSRDKKKRIRLHIFMIQNQHYLW